MLQGFDLMEKVQHLQCKDHKCAVSFLKLTPNEEAGQCSIKCVLRRDSLQIARLEQLINEYIGSNHVHARSGDEDLQNLIPPIIRSLKERRAALVQKLDSLIERASLLFENFLAKSTYDPVMEFVRKYSAKSISNDSVSQLAKDVARFVTFDQSILDWKLNLDGFKGQISDDARQSLNSSRIQILQNFIPGPSSQILNPSRISFKPQAQSEIVEFIQEGKDVIQLLARSIELPVADFLVDSFQNRDGCVDAWAQIKNDPGRRQGYVEGIIKQNFEELLPKFPNYFGSLVQLALKQLGLLLTYIQKIKEHEFAKININDPKNDQIKGKFVALYNSDTQIVEVLLLLIRLTALDRELVVCGSNALFLLNASGYDFSFCDFRNIAIENISLKNPSFRHANLEGSQFTNVSMSGANLIQANLAKVRWTSISYNDKSPIKKVQAIAISKDERIIVSGGSCGRIILWERQSGIQVRILTSHQGSVNSLCFSPDGLRLLSASKDQKVKLWNATNWTEILEYSGHQNSVKQAVFSPNGQLVASVDCLGNLRIWNASTKEDVLQVQNQDAENSGQIMNELHQLLLSKLLKSKSISLCFSPCGKQLAYSSKSVVQILNSTDGTEIMSLEGHSEAISYLKYSPNGTILATGSTDKTIILWDVSSRDILHMLSKHGGAIRCLGFTQNSSNLISSSDDRSIIIWEVQSGQPIKILKSHSAPVLSLDISPSDSILVSASKDKSIVTWDLKTKEKSRQFGTPHSSIWTITLNPQGKLLATGGKEGIISLWDVSSGDILMHLPGHDGSIWKLAFSPCGNFLCSGGKDGYARVWNLSVCDMQSQYTDGSAIWACGYTHSGNHLVLGSAVSNLIVASADNLENARTVKAHEGPMNSLAISKDDKLVVTGGRDKLVKLWDIQNLTVVKQFNRHANWVRDVGFAESQGAKLVVSVGDDAVINAWDLQQGTLVQEIKGHYDQIWGLGVSHSGKVIATGGNDKAIRIWDLQRGIQLQQFINMSNFVTAVDFSKDGCIVCSIRNGLLCLFEPAGCGVRRKNTFMSSLISPDGKRLATWDSDNRLKVWNATNGVKVQEIDFNSTDELFNYLNDFNPAQWNQVMTKNQLYVQGNQIQEQYHFTRMIGENRVLILQNNNLRDAVITTPNDNSLVQIFQQMAMKD